MYNNKKIVILGMAKSGYEVARLLSKYQNAITITDQKEQDEEKVEELNQLGIELIITEKQEDVINEKVDIVIKNPGIRKDHKAVLKAKKMNIPVVNELEVAYHFLPKNVTTIGITGSNGKTTTATMIYETMKKAGLPVHLAGNIGFPLSFVVQSMKENEYLVIEISDHQLLDMYDFKTDISILTNLSEVHLDFHGNYENYKAVKKKIFQHHTDKDLAIINLDNQDVLEITKDIKSHKKTFSSTQKADANIEGNDIVLNGRKVISLDEIFIRGIHNYENIMCVLLVLENLQVDLSILKEYLKTFSGVEHRIEYIDKIEGVSYYNDSKSTNTVSTITALQSFDKNVILLLGGLDRGHSFDPLLPYREKIKKILCYGETSSRIYKWALGNRIPCQKSENLKDATYAAQKIAVSGDTVLLSPACASWDQYENYEIRGAEFKEIVLSLK